MSHTDPPSPKGFGAAGPPSPDAHRELDYTDVAHDTHDVNVRAIIGFLVGLFVVTGVVFALMYGLFSYFVRDAAQNDPATSPLSRPSVDMPRSSAGNPFFGQAPAPQLLTHEPSVLATQRAIEQDVLGTYGWVDQKASIARMPIAEAKKLILQRGLPSRAEELDPSLGTRRAAFGESSSGRAIGRKKEEATKEEAAPAPAAPPKGHGQ